MSKTLMNRSYQPDDSDIRLRLVTIEDAPQLHRVIKSNMIRLKRYLPKTAKAGQSLHAAKRFVEEKIRQASHRKLFCFVIITKQQEIIGTINLKNLDWSVPKGELSYFIDQDHLRKGYTSAAVAWIVKYAFEKLKLEKLYAKVAPDNVASQKTVLKNGFIQEGYLRQEYRTGDGELIDTQYYGLQKSDYLKASSSLN
uniref:GNAT family N-acetyltransferase n=1 Tax=Roseihalotalea indica TaxID=2867963 RepID=A0AA49GRQ6_9BACT|nr:GNAT family N-acetyltransferase [Tunicatimonas sp. TK19036]